MQKVTSTNGGERDTRESENIAKMKLRRKKRAKQQRRDCMVCAMKTRRASKKKNGENYYSTVFYTTQTMWPRALARPKKKINENNKNAKKEPERRKNIEMYAKCDISKSEHTNERMSARALCR